MPRGSPLPRASPPNSSAPPPPAPAASHPICRLPSSWLVVASRLFPNLALAALGGSQIRRRAQ
ncbi:hypothetical protein ZEAMMB73_Zm00001d016080 [Zea mays]|uniref:Uncharacterized protein n=1 Tax=Zea mays TaxID=4577 RepID=A0A1D6H5D8_MAIZE|nr:hypothetical protein ZEAMMB73_Zm00001d016080 [Zea mays]